MDNQRCAPLGYQQIGASTLAAATPLTVPAGGAGLAIIIPDTAAVRWRDDGVAPSATVGMPLAAGAVLEYTGDLLAIQFIAESGSPVLNVSYYKPVG